MRVLVVGDAGSIFVKQYIEYVLLDGRNEVVLIQEAAIPSGYLRFYEENQVAIEPLHRKENHFSFRIPRLRSTYGVFVWCRVMKKKYGHFDLLHIHGLNRCRGNIGYGLRDCVSKIAVSVWGDELFRRSGRGLAAARKYYDCADRITVSTGKMLKAFLRVYGGQYRDRITVNRFAVGLLTRIDGVREHTTREEICKKFGIPHPDKRTVLIGYNGREAQRHIELTKALQGMDRIELDKITLVYTMTYGVKSAGYLKKLEAAAKKRNCDFIVLQNFLNEEEMAQLRSISDILLHAQLTDGFSASLQESLYSGTVVFNGEWLPYEEIPDAHHCMIEYADFDDMCAKLKRVLENFGEYRDRFSENRGLLREISSREKTTDLWKKSLGLGKC